MITIGNEADWTGRLQLWSNGTRTRRNWWTKCFKRVRLPSQNGKYQNFWSGTRSGTRRNWWTDCLPDCCWRSALVFHNAWKCKFSAQTASSPLGLGFGFSTAADLINCRHCRNSIPAFLLSILSPSLCSPLCKHFGRHHRRRRHHPGVKLGKGASLYDVSMVGSGWGVTESRWSKGGYVDSFL